MNDVDQDRICNKLAAVIVPITKEKEKEKEKEEKMIKEETKQENNETAAVVSMVQRVQTMTRPPPHPQGGKRPALLTRVLPRGLPLLPLLLLLLLPLPKSPNKTKNK